MAVVDLKALHEKLDWGVLVGRDLTECSPRSDRSHGAHCPVQKPYSITLIQATICSRPLMTVR